MPPWPSMPLHALVDGFAPVYEIRATAFAPEATTSIEVFVVGEDQGGSTQVIDTPMFVPRPQTLLLTPNSTPPREPTTTRKTLAGTTGLNLIWSSPRLEAENKDMPIALLDERLLCQHMGVVEEDGWVTKASIAKYVVLVPR
ncbi:hypothetical protein D1007_38117 [Hordeum vulgare]|nr:hypothetical protein D1007_38117 [Hordeum vulgare]